MKITIDYEVSGCKDCPYLTTGRTFGNDGRDGTTVYKCNKGVFGGSNSWGSFGLDRKPEVPPFGCPYFKSSAVERVASRLNISCSKLNDILNEEHADIVDLD